MKEISVILLAALTTAATAGPPPAPLRERLALSTFYQKHLMIGPFPVVSSAKVSDAALAEAAVIVRGMLAGRDDLLRAMAAARILWS